MVKAVEVKAAGVLCWVKCLPYPLILGAAQVPEIVFLGWVSRAREVPGGQTSSFCGSDPGGPSFSSRPTSCTTSPFSAGSPLVLPST